MTKTTVYEKKNIKRKRDIHSYTARESPVAHTYAFALDRAHTTETHKCTYAESTAVQFNSVQFSTTGEHHE